VVDENIKSICTGDIYNENTCYQEVLRPHYYNLLLVAA
jgi:hypothetical protein